MLHCSIIFVLDFLNARCVFGGGCSRDQRLQLPSTTGNRSGSRAGEDVAAGRTHIKLYPIHFSHIGPVRVQLPLEQFEDVRPQHIRQFFPKRNVRTSQARFPQLKILLGKKERSVDFADEAVVDFYFLLTASVLALDSFVDGYFFN